MFQVRSVFPRFLCTSFFCVFCTPYFALLMAQVCREYRGWDSAGGGGGKGHRDLRSNSCYLPPAVAGQIIGDVVPKLKKNTGIFTRFFPGNIWFPHFLQLSVTHPAYCNLCISIHLNHSYAFLEWGWNLPNLDQFCLLCLTFRTEHITKVGPCFILIWLICIYVCIFGSFTSPRTACGLRSVPRIPQAKQKSWWDLANNCDLLSAPRW